MTDIKESIKNLVGEYVKAHLSKGKFEPGVTHVPVSGKEIDESDVFSVVESALDGWFTTGRFNRQFEKELAKFIGTKHVLTVNSGSSANLLAVATLTSPELGESAIKPGDEVITVAASFPTTVNPWLQYGVIPMFVDVELPLYNIDVSRLDAALTPNTKAIMVAHTLGNPFRINEVVAFAKKHNLWLIEDCCDALGTRYDGKHVGNFGDIGTLSFYPAHHITMGEGGAVFTSNSKLKKIAESFRDWGRDCWCESGKDNTCGKRFEWQLGTLPFGYDHKYIYSHIGFNLKITDMQAALGLSQLEKLPGFIARRKENFSILYNALSKYSAHFILPEPTPAADPSWFGFLITIKPEAKFSRNDIIAYLQSKNIGTRLLFAGDLRRQPYFSNIAYRQTGEFRNTDLIVSNTFWVGVTPAISNEMVIYMVEAFDEFFANL